MVTVALIGGDGSGKSTLTRMLLETFPLPLKSIYMGANIESSNYALPWSRLALKLKILLLSKQAKRQGITDPAYTTTHHMAHRQRPSSLLRTILRLLNRLLEATYRHLVSALLQLRGYHIIYDRHFIFDTFLVADASPDPIQMVNRLYYWILTHLFPLPTIIILLHAAPEVMVARKNEATIAYLRERNNHWLRQGADFANFVCVDANQSIEKVYQDVATLIMTYYETQEITSTDLVEP